MRWEDPVWLYALIAVPFWIGYVLWNHVRSQKRMKEFASESLWDAVVPELDWSRKLARSLLSVAAFFFLVLALGRPQWGEKEEVIQLNGMDVLFLLDLSNSMMAEDVVPNRLTKAKVAIRSMVDELKGDRVGLIGFGGSTYVAVPLTHDRNYFKEILNTLSTNTLAQQGTDLGLALETASMAMSRGAASPSTTADQLDLPTRVVVLVTDGEDHEDRIEEGMEKVKEAGAITHVLGVGTEKGAPVPIIDRSGYTAGFKKDENRETVISALNTDILQKAAGYGSGVYRTLGEGGGEIRDLMNSMMGLERGRSNEKRSVSYVDRFQIFLWLSVICVLIELSIGARKVNVTQSGIRFVRAGVAILALSLFVGEVRADENQSVRSYLENEEGLDAFQKDKINEAKRRFGRAQAVSPELPELHFNQGVVALKEERPKDAIHNFSEAKRRAKEFGSRNLEGRAAYNLGESLAKSGDLNGAVQNLVDAIDAAKETQDYELERNARNKIAQLFQQSQQQQQQQKQQQDQQQQSQKNEDQQNQDNQNQQAQSDQQKQDDPQDGEDDQPKEDPKVSRGEPQKKKNLSEEDAKRVMSELANKEQEILEKLKKQNKRPNRGGKDW